MSATLDAQKFSKYFTGCPVVNIPGQSFPVDVSFSIYFLILWMLFRGIARNMFWGGIKVFGEVQNFNAHCTISSITILTSLLLHKKFT